MYYHYWGLHKPAFDNVPDPSMYVDCHASMENAIAETLFAIEEGDECIAVIVGDVGLGKTMTIRMIIDSLEQEKYKIALITNPGISFVQILQEIIGQLTGNQCHEKRKVNLLEIFNQCLFSTFAEGKKILVFIDEANAITPLNLEQLRLLTNMQSDKRNLFTMVLAGQIEFGRRLEHPKRANLFQRVGTYSRIDKLESAEKVKKYVETRLTLAGAKRSIFTEDAFDRLWVQSDRGVPRLVNKLSKLCLKAGETNDLHRITGEIVDQIGSRFHKLTGPAIEKRRSRTAIPRDLPAQSAAAVKDREILAPQFLSETPDDEYGEAALPARERALECPQDGVAAESLPAREMAPEYRAEAASGRPDRFTDTAEAMLTAACPPEEPAPDSGMEICIGQSRITIDLPEHLLQQSLSSSQENRFKLAGGLAAETLRKHPHLIESQAVDPVPIWVAIRDFVLTRMSHAAGV
jgi:type II secretory pathway predicted ATPase ExeA